MQTGCKITIVIYQQQLQNLNVEDILTTLLSRWVSETGSVNTQINTPGWGLGIDPYWLDAGQTHGGPVSLPFLLFTSRSQALKKLSYLLVLGVDLLLLDLCENTANFR